MNTIAFLSALLLFVATAHAQTGAFFTAGPPLFLDGTSRNPDAGYSEWGFAATGFQAAGQTTAFVAGVVQVPPVQSPHVTTTTWVVPLGTCANGTITDVEMFVSLDKGNFDEGTDIEMTLVDPSGTNLTVVSRNSIVDLPFPGSQSYGAGFDDEEPAFDGTIGSSSFPLQQTTSGVNAFKNAYAGTNPIGLWTLIVDWAAKQAGQGADITARLDIFCNTTGSAVGDPHISTLNGNEYELAVADETEFFTMYESEHATLSVEVDAAPQIRHPEKQGEYISDVGISTFCGEKKVKLHFEEDRVVFEEGSMADFGESCDLHASKDAEKFNDRISQSHLATHDFYAKATQFNIVANGDHFSVFYTGHHYNVLVTDANTETEKRSLHPGLLQDFTSSQRTTEGAMRSSLF